MAEQSFKIYKDTAERLDKNALDIASLKRAKVDKPSIADDNKIPRAKSGDVEWVDVGHPTDEQTNNAVASWLNEHPEATTTVQDGSVTEPKIFSSFCLSFCSRHYKCLNKHCRFTRSRSNKVKEWNSNGTFICYSRSWCR